MAEAIGLAASIANIIQVVGQITKISYSFISDVRNASKSQKQYLQEVSALADVLLRLEQALDNPQVQSMLAVRPSTLSKKTLEDCYADLSSLQDLLTRRTTSESRIENFKTSLRWQFDGKEIKNQIEILHRYRELFVAAISSDTFTVAAATYDKVDGLARDQDRARVLEWLSQPKSPRSWTNIFDSACPGTCQWFLNDKRYCQWRDGPAMLCWAFGKPGVGKTYLATIVLDDLINAKGHASRSVIYHFCDFAERKEQTAVAILQSWLRQILEQGNESQLSSLLQHCTQSQPPLKLKVLTKAFLEVSSLNPDTFLIVDALDELENRKAIFPILRDAVKAGLKVFITSRDIPDIKDAFGKDYQVEIEASQSDLEDFIDSGLQESELYDIISTASGIIPAIVENSGGTFLLARLLVTHLASLTSVKEMRIALKSLPSGLTEAYQSTLDRVLAQSPSRSSLAMRVFGWIAHAERRLNMPELVHALAVEEGSTEIDEENMRSPKIILQVCIGLVSVHPLEGTISLIHATAYDFFRGLRDHYQNIHIDMATICMTYLRFGSLAEGPCDNIESLSNRIAMMPFLRYATQYWGIHAHIGEKETMPLIRKVLDDVKIRGAAFQVLQFREIQDPELSAASFKAMPKGLEPLHVAAYWNLIITMDVLLQKGIDTSQADNQGWSPLHWTCSNGTLEATEILLNHGAKIDAVDLSGWTPLFWAAFKGHKDLVTLLLNKGANHLLTDSRNWTVLHWASLNRDDSIAEVFMRHHADYVLNLQKRFSGTRYKDITVKDAKELVRYQEPYGPFRWDIPDIIPESAEMAAERDDVDTITAILKGFAVEDSTLILWGKKDDSIEPADISLETDNLWYSSSKMHPPRFIPKKNRLLEIGIKTNKPHLVKLMLEMGANPEEKFKNGITAIDMAASRKDPRTAKILLEHGAKPHGMHLYKALSQGFEKTVELFVKSGVDVNVRLGKRSVTPLMLACSSRPLPHDPTLPQRLVKLLLENGASVWLKDTEDGFTAFDFAFKNANSHILKILLDHGDMPDTSGGDDGAHMLRNFVKYHFPDPGLEAVAAECLDLLLNRLKSQQKNGNSVMISELVKLAYTFRNWNAFNYLTEKVEDLPALEELESGLQDAVEALESQAVEILLGQRAKTTVGYRPGSLFPVALEGLQNLGDGESTMARFQHIWHTLLRNGEDINAPDTQHQSALAYLATSADSYPCQTDLIQLLIDSGADIYQSTSGLWDPVLLAAFHASPSSLRCLMSHAAKHPKKDHWLKLDGWSPVNPVDDDLGYICASLSTGRLITTQDEEGLSLIEKAVDLNNERLVSKLLNYGADVNTTDKHGFTLLHSASAYGHEAIVRVLLDHDANVHDTVGHWFGASKDIWTFDLPLGNFSGYHGDEKPKQNQQWEFQPLHFAARLGHYEVVKLLVFHGADLEAGTKLEEITPKSWCLVGRLTPLRVALGLGCKWFVSRLQNRTEANFKVAEFLVDSGASVHAVGDDVTEREIELFDGHDDLWEKLRSGITTDDAFSRSGFDSYWDSFVSYDSEDEDD